MVLKVEHYVAANQCGFQAGHLWRAGIHFDFYTKDLILVGTLLKTTMTFILFVKNY